MVALSISEIIKINFSPKRTDKKSEMSCQKGCHRSRLCLIFSGRKTCKVTSPLNSTSGNKTKKQDLLPKQRCVNLSDLLAGRMRKIPFFSKRKP